MALSLCWNFKLSNEGSFVEIGQEMTKLGWKVWKKSLRSLRAELQSLRAVCMQRWSFRRRSHSWETSFDWSEMKVRAFTGVSSHPAVSTSPGFQIKWTQPDFSWFFMRTIPAAENRGVLGDLGTKNCAVALLVSQAFQPGVIRRNPTWHDLRYINCRNANWKFVQLCRSVLRAVFDVFHFMSASLVHGVSFSLVLHERSQQ